VHNVGRKPKVLVVCVVCPSIARL